LKRGLHNVQDEIIFANHEGYVFHDSRGFEAGGEDELKTVQAFVRRRSRERELKDRLHAIWFVLLGTQSSKFMNLLFRYCIPMDNDRPSLDLKHFNEICPDKNGTSKHNFMEPGTKLFQVPVIAVFTKYDQFKRDVMIKLEDQDRDPALLNDEVERIFGEYYLTNLRSPSFVRLEGEGIVNWPTCTNANHCCAEMHKEGQQCTELIEMTANALHGGAVALILLSIQRGNLELNIKKAIEW
jgi:hypothetical protein